MFAVSSSDEVDIEEEEQRDLLLLNLYTGVELSQSGEISNSKDLHNDSSRIGSQKGAPLSHTVPSSH